MLWLARETRNPVGNRSQTVHSTFLVVCWRERVGTVDLIGGGGKKNQLINGNQLQWCGSKNNNNQTLLGIQQKKAGAKQKKK